MRASPSARPWTTNYAFGANPATLREKYREAHDLIIKAWAEPDVFAWNGTHNKLRYVNIWPRPIQKPPPIWVPGRGFGRDLGFLRGATATTTAI